MPRPNEKLEGDLRRIRLVLMDIDGTLVTSSNVTFDNVSTQLRRLKRLGVHFSVATGRSIAGSRPILDRLRETVGMRMPPSISYNGAVLLSPHDGSLVERHLLKPAQVRDTVRACLGRGLWPLVYACHDTVCGPPLETVYLDERAPLAEEFNGMATRRVNDLGRVEEDVVAILADAETAAASDLLVAELSRQLGGSVRVTTSGSKYLEICSLGASKLVAMRRLATLHQVRTEEVMAIGDNLNDLDMIRAAGVGVAVGNAPGGVKAVADYSCGRNSAEGVVEALRMLVRVLQLRTSTQTGIIRCATSRREPHGQQGTTFLDAS